MSQRVPKQSNIGKHKTVSAYSIQREADTAIRELERFEKTVHRGQRLQHRGPHDGRG